MRIAVALTAVLLAVSGCSDDPAPSSLPPLPSPTAASAASPLPVPEAAKAETPQGASAFARYFFDVVNRAYTARDATLVRTLSGSTCKSCRAVAEDVQRLATENHSVPGRRYILDLAVTAPPDEAGRYIVDFRFTADPYIETAENGDVVRRVAAQAARRGQALLEREGGEWRMAAIRLVD